MQGAFSQQPSLAMPQDWRPHTKREHKVAFTEELSELLARLVKQIPYEYRRQAMGDIVLALLEEKSRKAESTFLPKTL